MAVASAVCVYSQGSGESLCGVWEHSATSEERGRLSQQCDVILVLGKETSVLQSASCDRHSQRGCSVPRQEGPFMEERVVLGHIPCGDMIKGPLLFTFSE